MDLDVETNICFSKQLYEAVLNKKSVYTISEQIKIVLHKNTENEKADVLKLVSRRKIKDLTMD